MTHDFDDEEKDLDVEEIELEFDEDTLLEALARAKRENTSLSDLVNHWLEGYASGGEVLVVPVGGKSRE